MSLSRIQNSSGSLFFIHLHLNAVVWVEVVVDVVVFVITVVNTSFFIVIFHCLSIWRKKSLSSTRLDLFAFVPVWRMLNGFPFLFVCWFKNHLIAIFLCCCFCAVAAKCSSCLAQHRIFLSFFLSLSPVSGKLITHVCLQWFTFILFYLHFLLTLPRAHIHVTSSLLLFLHHWLINVILNSGFDKKSIAKWQA